MGVQKLHLPYLPSRQVVLKRFSLPRRLHVAPAPAQVPSRGTFLIAIYIIKIFLDWKKNFSHFSLVATLFLGLNFALIGCVI